jgi:putative membrane protein
MMDWDGGMSAAWWPFMILLWALLIALIAWALVRLLPSRSSASGPAARETPEQELDRRLVRGEIDTATYDELRERLRSSQAAGRRAD